MQLLPTKNSSPKSSEPMPEFTLRERRGLKIVYWGIYWTYLSIWLLLLIAVFQGVLEANLLPQLDVELCKYWSNVGLAARGGLWLAGSLLMLAAPSALNIRKYAFVCLILDCGFMGVNVARWFELNIEVDLTGVKLVSLAFYLIFLKNLSAAMNDNELTRRCGKVLSKIVYSTVFVGIAYVGIEYHAYFRYASFVAAYLFLGALTQYFTTLAKLRKPLRNAFGFA